jgi:NADPH:quinone reductase-like Zn-dependent oxidoreductase
MFMLVKVDTSTLEQLAAMVDNEELRSRVAVVLPLAENRRAHELLEGVRLPRPNGKVVLDLSRG